MKYKTLNEFKNFDFSDSYIAELNFNGSSFTLLLDNVKILPENSCNRDIRIMRTNQLLLRIMNASINAFIEEGYQVYDADGRLLRQETDRQLDSSEYPRACKELVGCIVYTIEKCSDVYRISIDTEDHTWLIQIRGTSDQEEWEHFLNLDSSF